MTDLLLSADTMALGLRVPLSVMNFLQYAIWGAWFVVLGNYLNSLGFSRSDIGRIYATMSLGAILSPMFVGTVADRYFPSQQMMAVLHLAGAVLLYWMAQIRTPRAFYWVTLVYALVYTPTLSLSNAVIFANVSRSVDFAYVRVLGTIGWIAAGLSLRLFIKPGQQVNNAPLLLASALSLVLGAYSFLLPDTPPAAAGEGGQAKATLGVGQVEVTDGGQGYDSEPAVDFDGGGGTGARAAAEVEGGQVKRITVKAPGTGYTSAPTVRLSGGGGRGAEARASLGVAAVEVVDGGRGYKTTRAVVLVGGGEGQEFKPASIKGQLDDNGTITAFEVTKPGSGYTSVPTVAFPEPGVPFLKAVGLMKDRAFAVFIGVSFFITIALAFYYSFTALYLEQGVGVKPENVAPLMTIGQWVEIGFMLSLPWFIDTLGIRAVLILGMAAWGVRYAIFAARPPLGIVLIGVALHGICFDFFFAAGMIHTEDIAPPDVRASAQSLFGVVTYGLGMYLGTELSGWLNQRYTREVTDPVTGQTARVTDWRSFWLVPCVGVLLALALFLLLA